MAQMCPWLTQNGQRTPWHPLALFWTWPMEDIDDVPKLKNDDFSHSELLVFKRVSMFYRKLCSAVHLIDSICKIWWVSMYSLNHCNWMSPCIHSFFEMNWWKSIAGSPNLWSWNRNRWSWTNILMSFLTVGSWLISPDLPFNIPKKTWI